MDSLFNQIPELLIASPIISLPIIFILGIITSLSPCVLSLLPILVGYIGGYSGSRKNSFIMSLFFVLGLGITFAILGILASYMGTIFGQIGRGWYLFASLVAIFMGLSLLGVIKFNFPGLKRLPFRTNNPLGAIILGMTFGLVASPCSTPVLAAILTFVSTQGQISYGGVLLLTYGIGHGTPLIVIGTFTSLIKELPHLNKYSKYFSYISGVVLILLGLYLFNRFL